MAQEISPQIEDDVVVVPSLNVNTVVFDPTELPQPNALATEDTMVLEEPLVVGNEPSNFSAPLPRRQKKLTLKSKSSSRQFLSANRAPVQYDRAQSKYNSCNDWLTQLRTRQQSQMTPEIQERIARKARRQKRRGKKAKRAKTYQRCQEISRNAYWSGVTKSMSSSMQIRAQAAESRQQMKSLSSAYARRAVRNYEAEDDEEDEAVEELLTNLEVAQVTDIVAPSLNESGIQTILNQLRREPTNDEELATKFALYEDYLATVEESRQATHDFWDDCKEEFVGPSGQSHVAQSIQQTVDQIDSQDNLGIVFHPNRWFVYDMTQQADKNNTKLKGLLHSIEIKLELLNKEDDDCPFCLESLAESEHVTLGCCHKACTECWSYWQELRGANAFCPLCRQTDFIENIMS